jgi:hypothetical protein
VLGHDLDFKMRCTSPSSTRSGHYALIGPLGNINPTFWSAYPLAISGSLNNAKDDKGCQCDQ